MTARFPSASTLGSSTSFVPAFMLGATGVDHVAPASVERVYHISSEPPRAVSESSSHVTWLVITAPSMRLLPFGLKPVVLTRWASWMVCAPTGALKTMLKEASVRKLCLCKDMVESGDMEVRSAENTSPSEALRMAVIFPLAHQGTFRLP